MTAQQSIEKQSRLVDAIVNSALQPHYHELVRHLGQVVGIKPHSRVLLVATAPTDEPQRVLQSFDCEVEVASTNLHDLVFDTNTFDAVIIATPLHGKLHPIACELARVLKPNGSLGMVVLSVYRDQMPDDSAWNEHVQPLLATTRPAAAYRAVLAECGFTAFVTEDRRRDVRRVALDSYRQNMLHTTDESSVQPQDVAGQVLSLMAAGGVGVALITAENGR
jgi:SAM-dependent methyltransferase